MKITDEMIHPEIRRRGTLVRKVFNFKSKKGFVRTQKLVTRARGLMKSKGLEMMDYYTMTPSHYALRMCAFKAPGPVKGAAGLLWMHGGGYAIGTPEQDSAIIKRLVDATGCVAVSPDYRLSTQTPYPAAIDDCYHALLWMKVHARELGIRDDQIFVGGDSAGGSLAAAVTLMARDKGEVSVAFQMPLYPMLDDRMITPSSQDNDAPIWNTQANTIAWEMYLGSLYGTEGVPAYAAPSRAESFAGLPPTYTFVGGIEPFHDETVAYIEALKAAGVEAEIDVYPGCFHAFETICPKAPVAQQAISRYVERFARAAKECFAKQP